MRIRDPGSAPACFCFVSFNCGLGAGDGTWSRCQKVSSIGCANWEYQEHGFRLINSVSPSGIETLSLPAVIPARVVCYSAQNPRRQNKGRLGPLSRRILSLVYSTLRTPLFTPQHGGHISLQGQRDGFGEGVGITPAILFCLLPSPSLQINKTVTARPREIEGCSKAPRSSVVYHLYFGFAQFAG